MNNHPTPPTNQFNESGFCLRTPFSLPPLTLALPHLALPHLALPRSRSSRHRWAWQLTGGPFKRKVIFQVPFDRCHVSGREGISPKSWLDGSWANQPVSNCVVPQHGSRKQQVFGKKWVWLKFKEQGLEFSLWWHLPSCDFGTGFRATAKSWLDGSWTNQLVQHFVVPQHGSWNQPGVFLVDPIVGQSACFPCQKRPKFSSRGERSFCTRPICVETAGAQSAVADRSGALSRSQETPQVGKGPCALAPWSHRITLGPLHGHLGGTLDLILPGNRDIFHWTHNKLSFFEEGSTATKAIGVLLVLFW